MEKQGKMKGNGRINPQYENDMKTIIDNLSNLSLYQTHTSSTLEELDRLEEEFLVNNIMHSGLTLFCSGINADNDTCKELF